MSNSFGYLDIILLGMIAGFIILRLRSILGRKTGHDTKVYPNFAEKKFSMPKKDAEPAKQNLNVLEGKEKKEFLKGAEIAYESILSSFATVQMRCSYFPQKPSVSYTATAGSLPDKVEAKTAC